MFLDLLGAYADAVSAAATAVNGKVKSEALARVVKARADVVNFVMGTNAGAVRRMLACLLSCSRSVYADGKRGFAGVHVHADSDAWRALRELARSVHFDLPENGAPNAGEPNGAAS